MRITTVLVGVVLISQYFLLSLAQGTCQLWQGQPALCGEIYTPNVTRIWAVLPQQGLASLMQNSSDALLPLKSLAKSCYLRSLYLLCTGYMPPCVPSNISLPDYFESLTCNSVCQDTNVYCKGITPTQNCAQLNPFRGSPAFPNDTFDTKYNNQTYTLPCGTPPAAYLTQNYSVRCEGPLTHSPRNDGTCSLRCPRKFFTDSEWKALMTTQKVMGWIGFVLVLIVIPPFVLLKARRKSPVAVQTWTVLSVLPLSLAFLLPSLSSGDIICTSDTRPATKKNFACVLQAILLQFSSVSVQIWCFWLMFDSLIFVLTKSPKYIQGYWYWGKVVFTNGLTLGLVIVTLATQAVESPANYTFCFVKASPDRSVFKGYDSLLLWMPLSIAWVLGLASWCVLFVLLIRMVAYKSAGIFLAIRSQIRLLIFVFYFFIALFLLLLYRFTQKPRKGEFVAAFSKQVKCWAAKGAGAPVQCRSTPHPRSPYGLNFASLFAAYGVPIVFCLCLGMVRDVKQFYLKLWHMVRTCSYSTDDLRELTTRSTSSASDPKANESETDSNSVGRSTSRLTHDSTTV